MTPADTRAAWYLIDLWRDGISYHVDQVDVLRLHEIASNVIARVRNENLGDRADLAEIAIGQERERWLEWLADTGYGVDFTQEPPPPCTPTELAEVYADRDGEPVGDWTEILLDGNTAGGWFRDTAKDGRKVIRIHHKYPDGTHADDCMGCLP